MLKTGEKCVHAMKKEKSVVVKVLFVYFCVYIYIYVCVCVCEMQFYLLVSSDALEPNTSRYESLGVMPSERDKDLCTEY